MCTIKILSLVHGPRELKQHMIQAIRSELQQFQNPWGLWPAPFVCFDNWDFLVASKIKNMFLKRLDTCIVPWNEIFTYNKS